MNWTNYAIHHQERKNASSSFRRCCEEFDEVERESYARQYGASVVMLDVFKRSGENQIIVSEKIANLLEESKAYFPDN